MDNYKDQVGYRVGFLICTSGRNQDLIVYIYDLTTINDMPTTYQTSAL